MIYISVRKWVDRRLRGSPVQAKIVVMPAILPAFAGLFFGDDIVFQIAAWSWFVAWSMFVGWRYWLYMREVSVDGDHHYDRSGKFKLAREYHSTESATAARARKKRNG